MTEPLLDRLVADLRPVRPLAVARRLTLGAAAGAAAATAIAGAALGWRPDMAQALAERSFWLKLAYVLALAATSLWAVERLARPGGGVRRLAWTAAPVAALWALAAWQLAQAPAPLRPRMLMGVSSSVCPALIALCSLPPLAGLIWAVRGLAPTRLRLAGLATGLAAGGLGAAAYALHCQETSAPFMALWYTLGVALAGALGAAVAPRWLRW